ncbi:putative flagellar hook rod protein [Actinoplanes missouriensis 431]|uniref:Flagellar hook protein FlgE n=1 Tax=Actinoplanes missouriensis (strain ATCC 14538 / DSM 43046 / CBS 188.64 / JCM 3121 / NBRC 102363 / NCIMB 12654 / NRRL B-3342 / UNCC 431) TaxID=512565 RepID=I0HIM9_ACTM4|nr:flagellar hook-basal body complex protein [Actinoplanes missouriensis]BAL92866.1 putative flagellar hook rod protein [Actinoplanes missouriensis 431]
MLRSLYSGISGLNAHQRMIDVTGNNIANVNTVGYKSSQVQFQDALSQMMGAAGSPQNGQAGTNAAQVGLGVRVAGITSNFSQGSAQTTGKSGDMMIQGDGFFITRSGNENLYTRAGSFFFDANGTLTTTTGEPVQGWTAEDGKVNAAGKPGDIRMPLGATIPPEKTTTVTLKGNLSSDNIPDVNNPDNYGVEDTGNSLPGYITSIPVKVFDDQGNTHTVTAKFTRTENDNAANTSKWRVQLLGEPVQIDDGNGNMVDNTVGTSVDLAFAAGKPQGLDNLGQIDIGGYKMDMTDVTSYSGLSDARVFDTDGQTAGALTSLSYTVSDTGEIIGVYSNGLKQTLGQVAMATFKNVAGLEKVGNSLYRTSVNSGYAQVGQPGGAGMGQVISGALEMSNVDLAQEFTNLVVAQRGFQANSRIITTSDEILQELVSMKR